MLEVQAVSLFHTAKAMSRRQVSSGSGQGVQKKIRLSIHEPWESNKENSMPPEKLNELLKQEEVRYDSEEEKRKAATKRDRSKITLHCKICGKSDHNMVFCPYTESCPRDAKVCHGVDIVCICCGRSGGHEGEDLSLCAVRKECWRCGTAGDHWVTECPRRRNKQQPAAIEKEAAAALK